METNNAEVDFRTKLNEVSNKYQNLLQETHNEALLKNRIQAKRWEDYKKDLEELSDRLISLRDKLSHSIMVPIGKRALMRGRLVHTNEILVCLGDGWFAKQSAKQANEICQRRIKDCDEMLQKLKKEEELFNSRKSFPFESEAFSGGDQIQEIFEPYDEEEEDQWRRKHRQKEKEYREKLSELKKNGKTKIETEEDLWRRLDALDLQEEMEDELNRMGEDVEVEEEEDEDTHSESDSDSDDTCETEEQEVKKTITRRVSFKEVKDNKSENYEISESCDDNLLRIVFKHSDTPVKVSLVPNSEITTPSDIYSQYLKQKTPKSILKPSIIANCQSVDFEGKDTHPVMKPSDVEEIKPPVEPVVKAINEEVMEHIPATPTVAVAERPVSRFKAARMASKR